MPLICLKTVSRAVRNKVDPDAKVCKGIESKPRKTLWHPPIKHESRSVASPRIRTILSIRRRACDNTSLLISAHVVDLTYPRLRSIVPINLAVGITQIQAGSVVQACFLEAIPLGDNIRNSNRRHCVLVHVGGRREGVSGSHHDYVVMLHSAINDNLIHQSRVRFPRLDLKQTDNMRTCARVDEFPEHDQGMFTPCHEQHAPRHCRPQPFPIDLPGCDRAFPLDVEWAEREVHVSMNILSLITKSSDLITSGSTCAAAQSNSTRSYSFLRSRRAFRLDLKWK